MLKSRVTIIIIINALFDYNKYISQVIVKIVKILIKTIENSFNLWFIAIDS